MLNCPFCGGEYGERGLKDGRCRDCGSVLAWQDEGDSIPAHLKIMLPASALAPGSQSSAPATPLPIPRATTPPASAAGPVSPATPSGATRDVRQGGEQETRREPAAAPTEPPRPIDPRMVTACWGTTAALQADPRMTLKGQQEESGGTDWSLDIPPRQLQAPDQGSGGPADYELLNIIGEGAVGVVYAARQAAIDRQVAVKLIRTERREDPGVQRKFLAEAVVTGDLDHPNIVPIYELGRTGGGEVFYSMKQVRGTPWSRVIASRSQVENLEILMKVADAVAFAHARGVLHRDLKPENVMLGDFGEVLVMDWGIALPLASFGKTAAETAGLGGTPAYMAPEMATGPLQKIGPQSDVYLLGAILYEIITGRPPHAGTDVMACVLAAARNEIQPATQTGELMEIAQRALATSPERRYASVRAFQRAIRDYQSHSESILLATRAEKELATARQSRDYETFSRAVFGFQEALALWQANDDAREGLNVARLAYAECALHKGDYDLGLSLLEPHDYTHRALREKLLKAQQERDARQHRLRSIRRVVVLLVFLLFGGGITALVLIEQQRQRAVAAREDAVEQRKQAVKERDKADREKERADKERDAARRAQQQEFQQRQAADKARGYAEMQKAVAQEQRQVAEMETERADAEKRRAEQQSYLSEIGLAGEKIVGNAFGVAQQLLVEQQASPSKSKMRHWEWGRYWYLAQGGDPRDGTALRSFASMASLEALAISPDGRFVVVGGTKGPVEIWERETGRLTATVELGQSVLSLAFNPDGSLLAAAGRADGRASVALWRFPPAANAAPLRTLDVPGTLATSVAFSPAAGAAPILVTTADDRNIRRWNGETGELLQTYLGHLDTVWQAAFSPDGQRLVSASQDGSARVWNVESGAETGRFRGHSGAVYTVSFAPDGREVASAGDDRRILLWSLDEADSSAADVEELRRRLAGGATSPPRQRAFRGHTDSVRSVHFSPDGRFLLSAGDDNSLRLWDRDPAGSAEETSLLAELRRRAIPRGFPEGQLEVLRGHGGWVHAARFLGSADRLVSAGIDQQWKEWHVSAYAETFILAGHERPVLNAAFAPQGALVAAALDDGTVRLFDIRRQREAGQFAEGHEFLTANAAFFPGGERLATAAGDNTVRVWATRRGTQELALKPTGRRGALAISPDGSRILTASDDKTARLWDAASGSLLVTFDRHDASWQLFRDRYPDRELDEFRRGLPEITAVAMSPDGQWAFTGDAFGKCFFWHEGQEQPVRSCPGHGDLVHAAAFLPPGELARQIGPHVLTASADSTVAQWEVNTGSERPASRLRHPYAVTQMALAQDGRRVLTVSAVSEQVTRLWLWDLRDNRLEKTRDLPNQLVHSVAFSGGEQALVVVTDTQSSRNGLYVWSFEQDGWEPLRSAAQRSSTTWCAVPSPDGRYLLTAGGKGARLWDQATGAQVTSFRPHSAVQALAFSPAGDRLATAGSEGTAKLWDVDSRKALYHLQGAHSGAVSCLAFSRDGKRLGTGGEDGRVAFWNVATGEPEEGSSPLAHGAALRQLVFVPGGRELLTAGADGAARLWDLASGKLVHEYPGHSLPLNCAAVSADGQWLATGSDDKTARIWHLPTARQVAELAGHSAPVTSVAFSGDRLRVLTGSQDNGAKLWDTRFLAVWTPSAEARAEPVSVQEIVSLKQHSRELTSVGFSPDGRDVLTAGRDGLTVVWPGSYVDAALELSASSLLYGPGAAGPGAPGPEAEVLVDRAAIVNSPCATCFAGVTLTVSIEGGDDQDQLGIASQGSDVDQVLVRDQQLHYRGPDDGAPVEIGSFTGGRGSTPLVITLNGQATSAALEQVVRSITYRRDRVLEEGQRLLRFRLRDMTGSSGNAEDEKVLVRLGGEEGPLSKAE